MFRKKFFAWLKSDSTSWDKQVCIHDTLWRQHYVTTVKEYLISCHILLQYFELIFLQLQLVQILCKLIIISVNYEKKQKRVLFLWNTMYIPRWCTNLQTVTHSSSNHLITNQPGVERTTFRHFVLYLRCSAHLCKTFAGQTNCRNTHGRQYFKGVTWSVYRSLAKRRPTYFHFTSCCSPTIATARCHQAELGSVGLT